MPSGMRRLFVAATMAALALGVTAPGAMAGTSDGDTGYRVTIAARTCPTYTDITANRARNDIQESLENLGADTPYTAGQPISPAIEDANQPDLLAAARLALHPRQGHQDEGRDRPVGSAVDRHRALRHGHRHAAERAAAGHERSAHRQTPSTER